MSEQAQKSPGDSCQGKKSQAAVGAIYLMAILDRILHHSTTINIKGKAERAGGIGGSENQESEIKAIGKRNRVNYPIETFRRAGMGC